MTPQLSQEKPINFEDVVDARIRTLFQKSRNITIERSLSEPVKYDIQHHINATGSAIFSKVLPLPPRKFAVAQKEFVELLKQGVCKPSDSR